MSLIHLEKQGDAWRSRVEGHFILGAHPIETIRKGLPEAMAQAVVDHCAMAGEDVPAFAKRLMAEIAALAPPSVVKFIAEVDAAVIQAPAQPMTEDRAYEWQIAVGSRPETWERPEPRRARVPRKAAVVAAEAEQASIEPPESAA